MPRGNRTGPMGWGPQTGRGLGYCAGFSSPGYTKGSGMGIGRGYGGGRGWRGGGWGRGRFYYQDRNFDPDTFSPRPLPTTFPNPEEESIFLEQTLNSLKKEIEFIEKKLEEIKSKQQEE